jgi:hypothetical protein
MFWPAGLAATLAIVLAAFAFTDTRARRMANLAVEQPGFPDTYIMFSKSEPDRCYVVNRRGSTMRRWDRKQPGRKWNYVQIPAGSTGSRLDTWLVRSKREGKGTVFFVPVEDIQDWAYPFFYGFVRAHRTELDLPRVAWTQLFVNRLYGGLYLRVDLPFDLRKKDGGSGILRELLTVRGSQLALVNTRFSDACRVYAECVAIGYRPALEPPTPALAWLGARCPTEGCTLLLSNDEPYTLSLMPLPISLPELFARQRQRPPATFMDDRCAAWCSRGTAEWPFLEEETEAMQAAFASYASSFQRALRVHAEFYQTEALIEDLLPLRQCGLPKYQLRF